MMTGAMQAALRSRPDTAVKKGMLSDEALAAYVGAFNTKDDEFVAQAIPNDRALEFLRAQIPLFECPDKELELTYYFRWWTLRKHIKQTPDGFVFTEFLPEVGWAGKHNTINLAAGMHIAESRWLADRRFAEEYTRFWYTGGGDRHAYTSWLPTAACQQAAVTGDAALLLELLPRFIEDYDQWGRGIPAFGGHRVEKRENGLFYSFDFFDGGEISVSGHGYRPLLNAAMYSMADSIAGIAALAGDGDAQERFSREAKRMKQAVMSQLWDGGRQFFMVRDDKGNLADVRELYGLSPWFFNLPDEGYAAGFRELFDSAGFQAPYGPTFTEQRHPGFRLSYEGHECQWNGPSWPLATSMTLTAMENLLNNYTDHPVTARGYCDMLSAYSASHRLVTEEGEILPWIDENLHPYTGDWISRTRLKTWENGDWCAGKGGYERGKDYNHSTFCNNVICGLAGVRPSLDNTLVVNPLITGRQWDYFCLDRIPYHGHFLTVVWDKYGSKYPVGRGLTLLVDGVLQVQVPELGKITTVID